MVEPKIENVIRLCEVKRKNVRTTMGKLKCVCSDVLLFSRQWDDLENYQNSLQKNLSERLREVVLKEVELESRSLAVEERGKKVEAAEALVSDLEMRANGIRDEIEEKKKELDVVKNQGEFFLGESKAVEMRLTDLRKYVEQCTVEAELKTSQLEEVVLRFDLKEEQLKKMNIDLERHRREVSVEMERLDRNQTAERKLREEIERKGIALIAVLDKTAECRKDQELVNKKLDSQQKLFDERSLELICREKKLKELRLEIELMEEKVKSLNGEMEETCKQIEPKAKKLEDIERLIEEGNAHYESIKKLIKEHTEELASKEKKQNEMSDAISKLSLQIVSEEKTLERAKAFTEQASKKHHEEEKNLDSTRRHLEKCTAKYHSKKDELLSVKDRLSECLQYLDIKESELKSLELRFTEINKQVEEGEKRLQRLDNSNEELGRKIKVKQDELCSINKTIKERSGELEVKRNYLDQVQSSLTNLTAELKSKEGELVAAKKMIQDSLKDFQSKEEQQARLKKEFGLKEKELNTKDQQLKFEEQKLAKCVKYYEQKLKKLSSFCQQGNTDQQVVSVREINACDEKHLQLLLRGHLKKCSELQLDILRDLKSSSDPAKLVLETIQMMEQTNLDPLRKSSIYLLECLINMSPQSNSEVLEQAIKLAIEWKDTTLVKTVDAVDVLNFLYSLAAFCSAYGFDAENVQSLFDVTFLRKYIPSLCEALGVSALTVVNNVIPPEQQLPVAPNSSQAVQENTSSSHEDALKDLDGSASFSPNEVLTGLQDMKDPGSYVLNLVSDALMDARQRGELGLSEPIVKTLIPLFEELPRVVRPSEHLKAKARKVVQQWSLMMRNNCQISPLVVWGFLQLIVAYGLVDSIKQNETIQTFASNVAHFRQAPKLFQSLGLSFAIPSIVKQLRNERKVIQAIRFMFYFNLNPPPLEILKEEIINLRRSARRFELQVEESDAGKLRDIIELIEDFNLEIDLPVDLILKFMVPREAQNQNQCALVSSTVIPTIFGESTTFQAQSSHESGHKRPREDPRVTNSAIRPCFNPSSSHGR